MTQGRKRTLLATTAICALAWSPIASWTFMSGVDWQTRAGLMRHYGWAHIQWFLYLGQASNRTVREWLWIGAALASVPLLLCAVGWAKALLRDDRKLHGDARWATRSDMEKAGLRLSRRPP